MVNARLGSTKEFQKEGSLFPPVDRVSPLLFLFVKCNNYSLVSFHKVYSDMGGRVFQHPVMQKPPWNFVTYGIKTIFKQYF